LTLKQIAHIETDLKEKFGVPRQAGLAPQMLGRIIFEPEYRNAEALRGLEGFSHIWLIWDFSLAHREGFSPTVRPPRLGGNEHMGVFATRSPFRPNPLGLSAVKLEGIDYKAANGPALIISGADLVSDTPIYDIKPYIPYADCISEASSGWCEKVTDERLIVNIPEDVKRLIPQDKQAALIEILSLDPRPRYQDDPSRIYGLSFADLNINFRVENRELIVTEIS